MDTPGRSATVALRQMSIRWFWKDKLC